MVGTRSLHRDETEAFVRGAADALQGGVVGVLERITSLALDETSRRYRDLHRASFEVAVSASLLAFVLRDAGAPITWH